MDVKEEMKEFEAAGSALHRWDDVDYRKTYSISAGRIDYVWSTQRMAFAMWIYAKGVKS